jgi:hypothetical protein
MSDGDLVVFALYEKTHIENRKDEQGPKINELCLF